MYYYHNYILLTFLLLLWNNCSAQKKDTIPLTTIYQPIYSACQSEITDFPIYWGFRYESTADPTTYFYRVYGRKSDNNCRTEFIEKIDNKTLTIEGEGVNVLRYELKPAYNSFSAYWIAKVQFNSTEMPTVSWKVRVNYTANECELESTETLYRGTYRKIVSIPKPPKPILTALKAVVKFPESTTIISSQCPNTLYGETEYPYSYNTAYEYWSYECDSDGKPFFRQKSIWYNPPYLDFQHGLLWYKPGTVFRARFEDNGCVGEVSDPLAVSIQYSPTNCGDPKMDEIDGYTRDGRPDYHHYSVETVVCDKADGNPNCTQQKVFELLKSNSSLNVPIAADLVGTLSLGSDELSIGVKLFGSQLVFPSNLDPVENCNTVNLPGIFSMGSNLLTLAVFKNAIRTVVRDPSIANASVGATALGAVFLSQLASRQTLIPIANPITQVKDDAHFSLSNYTKFGHALSPGKVTINVIEDCNRIKIIYTGSGRHWITDQADLISKVQPISLSDAQAIANLSGLLLGIKNISSGEIIFKAASQRVINEFNKLPK